MRYNKKHGIGDDYQGESFSRSLNKESLAVWDSTETAVYEMLDSEGAVVSSGSLTKSGDNLSLILFIPKSDTSDLLGEHLILVHLNDTGDAEFDDVIAEYRITYKEKKASS